MPHIFYGQLKDSLFYGDGWDGVDFDASHARFCDVLEQRVKARWPGADVEIGRETDRRLAGDFGAQADEEIPEVVHEMAEELYGEIDAWIVEIDAWNVESPLVLNLRGGPDDEAPPPDISDERFGSVEDAAKRAAELGYDGEVFDRAGWRRGWVHADGSWTAS
jgi:hypothetical protein